MPIPPSIYARLAALDSAVRDLRQQADAVDALGNQLRDHARAMHKTAGLISLDVWAAKDALVLSAAGPMPDWASPDYDRDPGNVHHVPMATGTYDDGRLDPRIVAGCTVRFRRDYSSRIDNGPESTRVYYRPGDEATVRKAEAFSAWIGGVMVISDDVEFVSPPPTSDRVHGSPFAAADSTPACAGEALDAMFVTGDSDADEDAIIRSINGDGDSNNADTTSALLADFAHAVRAGGTR